MMILLGHNRGRTAPGVGVSVTNPATTLKDFRKT
jgi:hypothetical protein